MTTDPHLRELYERARAEGGGLVVYAGGDAPEQARMYTAGFSEMFPDIDIEVTVDLSKFHNARIDAQHIRGDNRVDVVHVQTVNDFPYWKRHGLLQPYRPDGLDQVDPDFVDPDGTYYALFVFAFSNVVDTEVIPEEQAPREATDYLRPDLKDRIVLTYPHDDDAVLFQFERIIAKHGYGWLEKLVAQNPLWVRGTATPLAVIGSGERAATFTSFYYLNPPAGDSMRFILPKEDFFQAWYQTGAILEDAPHPAAARLYMSYRLSRQAQQASAQWPARRDVQIPGWKPINQYRNTDPRGFREFMLDRARVERLRGIMEDFIGPVRGDNPTGVDRAWH
ncbi:ABC transporter substrate-binding protein [Streptomyces sp. NPDC001985]|uniref:ABC transporter substrate-binding protein n=1 Tax=Streptomyces sp. NPDC001985 TaxID=3154406 RepID=UPI00333402DC